MFTPYNKHTASLEDRIAWVLCQIIDDDAPMRWTRYRFVAVCIAANPELMADLTKLAEQRAAVALHRLTEDSKDDFAMACLREVAELDRKLEHTRYWYGHRIERLSKWAREELDEPLRTRFFSIVANGTPDVMEPPTSEQNYNGMKHRAEKAESELVRLRAAAAGVPARCPICGPNVPRPGEQCKREHGCAIGSEHAAWSARHGVHANGCAVHNIPPGQCTCGVKGPEHD